MKMTFSIRHLVALHTLFWFISGDQYNKTLCIPFHSGFSGDVCMIDPSLR